MTANKHNGPIALAAGGTGGHMFPAEAVAQELKRRGHRILLVTDARGARYAETFPADEQFEISAATPSVGGPLAKGAAAISILQGLFKARSEFKARKPVAALGFGGYPSLPAMKAAAFLKIPYGVHEQNGVLGRANRMLVKGAAFTAHAFPILDKCPNGVHGVEVGNPVRDAVAVHAAANYPQTDEGVRLLVFGGSQGASVFADTPVAAVAALSEEARARLTVVHQAREADVERVQIGYAHAGVAAEVAPFFTDLPERIAASHLVIARSGASTVTELSTIGRPSILVPLAIAMDDHQTGNARVLSEAGGALLLPEGRFNAASLEMALSTLIANPDRLKAMAEKAKARVKSGAASAIADLVEGLVEKRLAA
ncbi:MAG: UDP-N-acetylglucosamine--N-acetylmuramyl-(pentapeptide) pyrophosphoryl-undecaprenol N-acetylglucosamine transferase [Pseudomonadota bacterium]